MCKHTEQKSAPSESIPSQHLPRSPRPSLCTERPDRGSLLRGHGREWHTGAVAGNRTRRKGGVAESRSRGVIAIPFGVTESTGSNNCDGSLPKIGEETSINQLFFVMGTVNGPMGNMGNSETCRGQRTFGAMPHQFCSSVGTRGPLSGIGHTSARRKKGIFLLLSLW